MGFMPGCRKPDSKCRAGDSCNYCQNQLRKQAEGSGRPGRNRGSTIYGRTYGSSKQPKGAKGDINVRTGEGHMTQYYDDNTRLSWDTDGSGESKQHWTDQNKAKKNIGRHHPPGHAK